MYFACAWAPLCLCGRCVEMVVVDMLDRILDSLSEALMHKMPSSRGRRARCLSLATWPPSTPPSLDLSPRPLDPWTSRPTEAGGSNQTTNSIQVVPSKSKRVQVLKPMSMQKVLHN